MHTSHVLLSGMNFSELKNDSLFGRERLEELHINSSHIKTIQPSTFNSNLRVSQNLEINYLIT